MNRVLRPLLVFDAAGLALFAVTGTVVALDAGLDPIPAAVLGVLSGVGGGVLRDVVAREIPVVVRPDAELYAIPAALGALAVAFLADTGRSPSLVSGIAAALVFAVRVAAIQRGWRAPGARRPAGPR